MINFDNIGGSREGVTGIAISPAFENGKEEFKKERKEKRKGKREEDGSKKSVKLIASNRGEGGRELDLSKILTSKRKKKGK